MPAAANGKLSFRIGMHRFGIRLALACVLFLTSTLVHPARAQADPRIDAFLASVNKSISDLAGQPEPRAGAICHHIVSSLLNMDAIIEAALKNPRAPMSPRQRAAYRAAAWRWAVRDCVRRNRDNPAVPLELVGIRQGDSGDRLLATRSSLPAHTALWRLRGVETLQAVDVVIDGRSMVLSLRDETNAWLDRTNGDIDKAIDGLGR